MNAVEPREQTPAVPYATVHGLAIELNVPEEEVARVYRNELQSLSDTARVRSFLQVFAARRVRERLRKGAGEAY